MMMVGHNTNKNLSFYREEKYRQLKPHFVVLCSISSAAIATIVIFLCSRPNLDLLRSSSSQLVMAGLIHE